MTQPKETSAKEVISRDMLTHQNLKDFDSDYKTWLFRLGWIQLKNLSKHYLVKLVIVIQISIQ